MPVVSPVSAQQRFIVHSRAREQRRALRLRIVAAFLSLLGVGACVMRVQAPGIVDATALFDAVRNGPPTMPITAPLAISVANGRSFLGGLGQRDRMRATLCLASAIYYEAANEPDNGQRAVAQVVLNRVRHPQWPHTVCGVVYQGSNRPGCQFSFACDGAMARGPSLSAWIRARRVAEAALAGDTFVPVGTATFYHTTEVAPAWGRRMTPVGIFGAHIFYRLPDDGAEAASLPFRYAGMEPIPGPLPQVAPTNDVLSIVAIAPLLPVPQNAAGQRIPSGADANSRTIAAVAPSADARYIAGALPDSDIRPEYRESGTWIAKR